VIVNANDADIVLRSSDNVQFKVHRKNLEMHSDVLAAAESISASSSRSTVTLEVVDLTESSEVLDVLFQFMYRQPSPALDKVSFEVLAGVAEAAEKYQVFNVIELCKVHMQ
jgi:hypothetical protein